MVDHTINFVEPDIAFAVKTASGIHLGDIHQSHVCGEWIGTEYWFQPELEWHMDHEILDDVYPEVFEKNGNFVIYRDLDVLKSLLKCEYDRILADLDLDDEEEVEDDERLSAAVMGNEELLDE